jgi:hypothetical protein
MGVHGLAHVSLMLPKPLLLLLLAGMCCHGCYPPNWPCRARRGLLLLMWCTASAESAATPGFHQLFGHSDLLQLSTGV